MNSRSIKNNIIFIFFISALESLFLTFIIFILFFGSLHAASYEAYRRVLNAYNTDFVKAFLYSLIVFIIFIILMYILFSRKMKKVTSYIEEISKSLKEVSKGNMDVNIPIKRNDELGELAMSVNIMTHDLKELLVKEREWDNQRNNLITNLSHDLRTPLTSMLGFLGLIKNECKDKNMEHYLNITVDKGNQLKNSINQLFELTKITSYDFKLNTVEINLYELLEQVFMGFIPDFEENNMEYRFLSKDRTITMKADPKLLIRAFENIITNTIKYAKYGKYLDIDIKKINREITVTFINYGDEIPKESLKNIFEKYYRAEKTGNKKEGTGLGLAIVKTITELHGGKIEITSSKEKTEFKFKFVV